MKIAVLTEILSTHSGSRAPIELAKHLSLNNKVTLMAYSFKTDSKVKQELEKSGVAVILIDVPNILFGKWLVAFKFLPHLKGNDIISFHGTLPVFLVARLSGIPLVQTYYGTQLDAYLERLLPYQKNNFKDKFLNFLGNKITLLIGRVYLGLSNKVIAISQYGSLEAKKFYGQEIPFIYLGASLLSREKKPTTNYKLSVNILSVSRITPYKGFHLLIEAVKDVERKVNLFIIGSSPQPKYLDYLKKIGTANTKFFIDLSDKELARLYQNCGIYASCDRYPFFGLPPLEAALFGKPSVILDYCAAREIVVHQKTGFVAKDLKEFRKYLTILIDNSILRRKMGREAKTWARETFSWNKTAKEYLRSFQTLLDKTHKSLSSKKNCGAGGSRTHTIVTYHRFLRPTRLPIPPPRQI